MYRSLMAVAWIIILSVTSCNNTAKTEPAKEDSNVTAPADNARVNTIDTTPVNKPMGGDADEHGCITSAGYKWSMIKNTCIRIFETGIKMDAKDASLDKSTVAYIVFSDDKVRVELFLPTQKKSVVIRKTEGTGAEPSVWENGPLKLSMALGMYTLFDEGKMLYQGSAVK